MPTGPTPSALPKCSGKGCSAGWRRSLSSWRVVAHLYTEMPVKVSWVKQPIDAAEWIITTVTHSLSTDGGFTTQIELEVEIYSFEME